MSVAKVLSFASDGKNTVRSRPTVLVVSPAVFTEDLKDALLTENKQQCSDRLQFLFCEHVEDVLSWSNNHSMPPVDYVVLALDPRDSTCVAMAEDNISKIDSTYVEAGRLCFVNGACSFRPAETGAPLGVINVTSQKYSAMLINGDVLKTEKRIYLASRIVRLASIVLGLHTGVPMSVDIPGYI